MPETILHSGPGFEISVRDEAKSGIPYGPVDRGNGDQNHGFIDLADRPELASSIPEASRSPGLIHLLEVINQHGSPLMSLGCECGVFETRQEGNEFPPLYIGSYIAVAFRSASANTAKQHEDLACAILGLVKATDQHHVGYNFRITPLWTFFGHNDCFELELRPIAYGASEARAWDGFGYACDQLAQAIEKLISERDQAKPLEQAD